MDLNDDKDFSDDEVFFGKITLKEVKKRILIDLQQKNTTKYNCKCDVKPVDFKIIETSSEPDLILKKEVSYETLDLKSTSDSTFNRHCHKSEFPVSDVKCEDSFLEIEKMVTELCMSPEKSKNNNLDNTLDVVDFILHHTQSQKKDLENGLRKEIQSSDCQNSNSYFENNVKVHEDKILSQSATQLEAVDSFHIKEEIKLLHNSPVATPQKDPQILINVPSINCKHIKNEPSSVMNTPISTKKLITNVFKTPKIPTSIKKDNLLGRTPNKSKAYQHIASPVATYIKNCPQVPLVKDVHPKKPLPSTSSIPKLMKSGSESKIGNKENIILPSLAYRSAKKTKVINVNKEKLPQSNWAQKLTSLPKPVVLKHDHRETVKKPLLSQQEDSFANLTLHQAEVSVCTQKLAYNKT